MTSEAPDVALAVEAFELGKDYRLGELSSLPQRVGRILRRTPGGTRPGLHALTGVSFGIRAGEAVGVVGSNGSGKSTLLRIISGTTLPTHGAVHLRGRVLPLLAVGLGFHPELTGRENVTLFGTSIGVPPRMIASRIEAIATFAELERHMDTPVKRFSSGMISRLSVAIAVQFPADIYVLDEVLAVVDEEYQQRCITEISRLHASGSTILFVSHDRAQVETVCNRVIWLDHGMIRSDGPVKTVLDAYKKAEETAAAA